MPVILPLGKLRNENQLGLHRNNLSKKNAKTPKITNYKFLLVMLCACDKSIP
jgi:hypothetical protein